MKKKNSMNFDISNKNIILVGGNGILGSEYVNYLKDKVNKIIIIDLKSNNIDKYIKKYPNIIFLKSNILNKKNFIKKIKESIKLLKRVDVLINNAAITAQFSKDNKNFFNEFSTISWKESIDVTLNGAYYACISVIPQMLKQKKGTIINISSHYGVVSPMHTIYKNEEFNCPLSYSVSKHAILGLTKWLATKYINKGIKINCISPGGIENNQTKSFINKYSKINPTKRMAKKNPV